MSVLSESFKNKLLPMNGYMKGGSDSGSKAQARATEKEIELQREQWQTVMNNLAPFTPLAQQYVSQLQNLSTLQGQGQALNDYYNSDQYKQMAGQARYQSLASAEATGGLGSTATGNQLAAIAPSLGQNYLSSQMNNYQNLANIGLGALQGQANAGQSYANNSSQLYQQQANAAAANANKSSGTAGFVTGAAGGALAGAQIGSMFGPGYGTAIGAGIGGLIGGASSLF
ncbi:DNA transfer protein [Pseudocitrobacter faecalis]|uniref:DNA transfer protein n=1 Tax=Pseudocitrobacter faecalis TaxID=1398493 RepID=UPI003314FB61